MQIAAKGMLPEKGIELRASPEELGQYGKLQDSYWVIPEGINCPECDPDEGLQVQIGDDPSPQASVLFVDESVSQLDLSRPESGLAISAKGTLSEGTIIDEVNPQALLEYINVWDGDFPGWNLSAGTICTSCPSDEVVLVSMYRDPTVPGGW